MTKVWRASGYIWICLHYMLEIRMGRKTKISRVFGHSLGRHRKIRQDKHLGRPIYTITKSKHLRKEKLIFPCNSLKYIIVLYLAKMGLHTLLTKVVMYHKMASNFFNSQPLIIKYGM